MSFSLLTVAILGIVAVFIYRQVRWGYKNGITRSLINLATLILCAIFGALASSALASFLEQLVFIGLGELGMMGGIEKLVGILLPAIHIILKMVLSLLLFIPIFLIMRFCVSIFFRTVQNVLVKKGNKKEPAYLSEDESLYVKKDKLVGGMIGVISGFMLSVIILSPAIGAVKSVNSLVGLANNYANFSSEKKLGTVKEIELLDKYSNDAAATVIDACGGRALYDLATRVTSNGQSSCANREIEVIGSIDFHKMLAGMSGGAESGSDILVEVEPLLDSINESLILKHVVVDVIRDSSSAWVNGDKYLGMEKPSIGDSKPLNDIMNAMLKVCSTTTFSTYEADLTTLINTIKIFWDNSELLTSLEYEDRIKAVTNESFLSSVADEVKKNPRMEPVAIAVDSLITDIVAIEIVNGGYTDEERNLLYKELAKSLSEAQGLSGSVYDITLSKSITEDFAQLGIYVPENAIGRIASDLSKNVPAMDGRVTDKEVKLFMEERGTLKA